MSSNIRLGFIGAGHMGAAHMEQFKKLRDAELYGLVVNNQRAADLGKRHGIPHLYSSGEEMLNDERIDAVVISTPNKWHAPLAIQALRAGKHVLLEKPMAMNGAEARQILQAGQEAGKVLMIGFHRRWEPEYLKAKEMVEQGRLGNVYFVKTGYLRKKGIPGWGSWFTRKADAGGGALIDIGVHMLDLSLWLLGNPKPLAVFAKTYGELGKLKKGLGTWGTPNWNGYFDVDDLAVAMIRLEGGITLLLEVSWAANIKTDSVPYVQLVGDKGGLSVHGSAMEFIGESDDAAGEDVHTVEVGRGDARLALCRHFLECIREKKEPLTSGKAGLLSNLLVDAIYESAVTEKEVTLKEIDFF